MELDLDPVIVKEQSTGELLLFPTASEAAAYVEPIDLKAGEYGSFYRLDGQVLTATALDTSTVVRTPTDRHDLSGLLADVVSYGQRLGYSGDQLTPRGFVNETWRRAWHDRRVTWPAWLDRRLHGSGPRSV